MREGHGNRYVLGLDVVLFDANDGNMMKETPCLLKKATGDVFNCLQMFWILVLIDTLHTLLEKIGL